MYMFLRKDSHLVIGIGREAPPINLNEHIDVGVSSSHQDCTFGIPPSSQSDILREHFEQINRYHMMLLV